MWPAMALTIIAFFGGYALFGSNGVLAWGDYSQQYEVRKAELDGLAPGFVASLAGAAEAQGKPGQWAIKNTRSSAQPVLQNAANPTLYGKAVQEFGEKDAFAAMRRSLHACRDNLGAVLVYLLVLVCGAILAMAVLSVISSLLGQFVVSVLITPLAGASMYLAWKDVFGSAITREAPALPETPQDGGGMVA